MKKKPSLSYPKKFNFSIILLISFKFFFLDYYYYQTTCDDEYSSFINATKTKEFKSLIFVINKQTRNHEYK